MSSTLEVAGGIIAIISILITLNLSSFLLPPKLSGTRNVLSTAEIINVTGAVGPESLAFDLNGEGPYTGVADGRILKLQDGEWVEFAVTSSNREKCKQSFAPELEHVCGRPLGLQFDPKTSDLYIADAYFGLLKVGPRGGLATPVVTEAEGMPLYFTNDMEIDDKEEVIYFTDTSTIFRRREFIKSVFSGDKTGRLIKFDKLTKQTTVLLKGLAFANGVALSKDRSFLIIAETTTCMILRYWLQGPLAGTSETFAEMPGYPDNIRRNSKGEFWVGLHAKRGPIMSWILSKPWVGKMVLSLPLRFEQLHVLAFGSKPHSIAVKLSEEGKVLEILEDDEGKSLRFISEVEERDGKLWIASVLMPFIGVLKMD